MVKRIIYHTCFSFVYYCRLILYKVNENILKKKFAIYVPTGLYVILFSALIEKNMYMII